MKVTRTVLKEFLCQECGYGWVNDFPDWVDIEGEGVLGAGRKCEECDEFPQYGWRLWTRKLVSI